MQKIIKNHKYLIIFLSITILIKLYLISTFNNNGWEPDSFEHFNQMRLVYNDFPNNLEIGITTWAKPLYIYPLAILVALGFNSLASIQIVNMLIFVAISIIVYKIILDITSSKNAGLIGAFFTQFSSVLLISSLTALTEPIFALMIILGIYYFSKTKYLWASFFIGISVLGRIEGVFFAGILLLFILYYVTLSGVEGSSKTRSNLKTLSLSFILLATPTLLWNFVGFLETGRFFYLISDGYPVSGAQYGTGSWIHYPKRFLYLEFFITISSIISFIYLIYKRIIKKLNFDHNELFLIFLGTLSFGFITTQIITWKFGLMGSAGLMRYFISILPLMIILGTVGLFRFFEYKNFSVNNKLMIIIGICIIQILFLLIHFTGRGFTVSDMGWIRSNEVYKNAAEKILELEKSKQEIPIFSSRPEIPYYLNTDKNKANYTPNINLNTKGIYIYTETWGPSIWGKSREDIEKILGQPILEVEGEVFVYEVN